MPKKTPPFKNYPEWTEARFNSFVKSALRKAWSRYPVKYKVLNNACVGKKINKKTGRLAKHFKCDLCKEDFPMKEVEVDHILPVGGVNTKDGWDGVIERLFCSEEGGRVLCKKCHKKVTYGK